MTSEINWIILIMYIEITNFIRLLNNQLMALSCAVRSFCLGMGANEAVGMAFTVDTLVFL